MGNRAASHFAGMNTEGAEDQIADWGGLFVEISDIQSGMWESELLITSPCPVLRRIFYSFEAELKERFDELLAAHEIGDEESPFETIARLYAEAFESCHFAGAVVEHLSDVITLFPDDMRARLELPEEFTQVFGAPAENSFTIYVLQDGKPKAERSIVFIDLLDLMTNVFPNKPVSSDANYRLQ